MNYLLSDEKYEKKKKRKPKNKEDKDYEKQYDSDNSETCIKEGVDSEKCTRDQLIDKLKYLMVDDDNKSDDDFESDYDDFDESESDLSD